jgi:hypothetical protein
VTGKWDSQDGTNDRFDAFWLPSIFGRYEFASAFRSPNTAQRNSHQLIGIWIEDSISWTWKTSWESLTLCSSPQPREGRSNLTTSSCKVLKKTASSPFQRWEKHIHGRNGVCTGNQSASLNKRRNFLLRWNLCKWTRIYCNESIQMFLTISMGVCSIFPEEIYLIFMWLFRVLQIPEKCWKLHDTHRMELQSLVTSINSISRQSVRGVTRFGIEFRTANCPAPSEKIQISYRFQESELSYLSVLLSSIWSSESNQKIFTNSEPRNWERKFLSVILSTSLQVVVKDDSQPLKISRKVVSWS